MQLFKIMRLTVYILCFFFGDCYGEILSQELPTLETERLILRKITMEDSQGLFIITSDIEVVKLTALPLHRSQEETEWSIKLYLDLCEKGMLLPWIVLEKNTNAIIGLCSFFDLTVTQRRGEISYLFARNAWNKGFATEVAQKLIEYGFKDLKLVRVQGSCHPDNYQSAKVLEKSGMQYEGLLRNYKITQGKPADRKMYAITWEDFESLQKTSLN